MVGAAVTVVVSVFGLTVGRYIDRRQQIEAEARLRKIPMYEEFLDLWFRVLFQNKLGKPVTERDMLKFSIELLRRLHPGHLMMLFANGGLSGSSSTGWREQVKMPRKSPCSGSKAC